MRIKFIAIGLFGLSQLVFSEPFRVSSYLGGVELVSEEFIKNMTSREGDKYAHNPSRALWDDLKKEAERGSSSACFDVAVVYFLGMGIDKNNQTAVDYFVKSYESPGGKMVAMSNANWIQHGPPRNKDLSDLTDSFGRKLDRRLIWTRDWLLYFRSALFGSENCSVSNPAEKKVKSLTEKPAPLASRGPIQTHSSNNMDRKFVEAIGRVGAMMAVSVIDSHVHKPWQDPVPISEQVLDEIVHQIYVRLEIEKQPLFAIVLKNGVIQVSERNRSLSFRFEQFDETSKQSFLRAHDRLKNRLAKMSFTIEQFFV